MTKAYRVLIADDEEKVLSMLNEYFKVIEKEYDCKFEIFNAKDGEKAIEHLIINVFDLAIIDNVMPKLDGVTLFKNIFSPYPYTQFILMTGYSIESLKNETIFKGKIKYLKKPVDLKKFKKIIFEVLFAEKKDEGAERITIKTSDLIMLLCISHKSSVISIRNLTNNQIGKICIKEGKIMQAVSTEGDIVVEGDDAFLEINSWEDVQTQILDKEIHCKKNISADLHTILMDDLKRVYDNIVIEKVDKGDISLELLEQYPYLNLPGIKNINYQVKSELKEKKMAKSTEEQLKDVLTKFENSTADIEASAVVSTDGLVMASNLPADVEEDRMGAMSAAMLGLGERSSKELHRGDLDQVIVKGDDGYIVLMSIGEDAVLVTMTNAKVKLGLLFLELKRTRMELEKIF